MIPAKFVFYFGRKVGGSLFRSSKSLATAKTLQNVGEEDAVSKESCASTVRNVAEMFIDYVHASLEEEVLRLPKKTAFSTLVMGYGTTPMFQHGDLIKELKVKLNRLIKLKDTGYRGVVVYFSDESVSSDGSLSAKELVEFHSDNRKVNFTPKSRAWFFAQVKEKAGIVKGSKGQKAKLASIYKALGWEPNYTGPGYKYYKRRDFFDRAVNKFKAKFSGQRIGKCIIKIKQLDKTSIVIYYG